MNTYQHFELRLEPRKELALLCQIAAGLAASGQFTFAQDAKFTEQINLQQAQAKDDIDRAMVACKIRNQQIKTMSQSLLITDVAHAILEQLRQDVEERVEDSPELYRDLGGVDMFPSE